MSKNESAANKKKQASKTSKRNTEPIVQPQETADKKTKAKRKVRAFPTTSFEEAYEFSKTIYNLGSGEKVRRLTLFKEMNKSPDSSVSRMLIINSNKYSLTKGGYTAEFLELTPKSLIALNEGNPVLSLQAKFQLAISDIDIYNFLFNRFVGSKVPSLVIIKDILIDTFKDLDFSPEEPNVIVENFIVNIKYLGLLETIAGAERIISLEHALEKLHKNEIPATVIRNYDNYQDQPNVDLVQVSNKDSLLPSFDSFDNVCFYITPIGNEDSEDRKHSNLFLDYIITPAIQQFNLKVVRADQIDSPGTITNQIIEYIFKSRLVIADLSFHNPNVFYELALRHVCRLPTVQIIRKADRIPFDLSQSRTIIIDNTDYYTLIPKLEIIKAEIASQVRNALNNPDLVDNPLTNVFPNLRLSLG